MPFLRPLPMAKVGLIALKEDREALLSVLHDLGVMQVEPISKEALEQLAPERGSDVSREVGDELLRFRAIKNALPPTPVPPRRFGSLSEVLDLAATLPIDAEVGDLKREEDRLITEAKALDEEVSLLEKFRFYTDRLELLQARPIYAFFGEAEADRYAELSNAIPGLSDADFLSHREGDDVRFLLVVRREQAEAVSRLAQQKGVKLVAAPRRTGTPAEVIPQLNERQATIDRRLGEIHARLTALSQQWYPVVAAVEEALTIENRKLEVYVRLGVTERAFALEGWIARRDRPALEAAVAQASGGRALIYDLPTSEEPPTVMANPKGVRWYEFFIRFYSLPLASEWDPTWVFAVAFPIFFGLMLGDIGYGAVILSFSLWMIAGFPGRKRVPGFLKNFPKLIMPPSAMRSLAFTLVPASLLAIGFGVVFNEFFGAHLLPFTVLDPLAKDGLGHLLLLAGYIGLGMVTLGFSLGALKEYFHHHYRGAIAKVGGIGFALGIAFIGLALLRKQPFWPPTADLGLTLAYVGLFGGFAMIFVGEGAMGFMVPLEVISHILSYTRIIGILLASVILAFVIDQISVGLFQSGPVKAVVGALILIVGQVFNIVLAVFEPGIQGARLLFVEYFSKFYSGNGRIFRPFGTPRTHTVASYETGLGSRGTVGVRRR